MSFEKLIEIFEEQKENYGKLLKYSNYKNKHLKEKNINEVSNTTEKERRVLKKIDFLEIKRQETLNAFLNDAGLKEFNIKLIKDKVQKESFKKFQKVYESLRETVDELKKINEKNTMLIQNTLEVIDLTLNTIKDMAAFKKTYSKKESESNSAVMFDKKG